MMEEYDKCIDECDEDYCYDDYRHEDCPWCGTLDSEEFSAYSREELIAEGFDIPEYWNKE